MPEITYDLVAPLLAQQDVSGHSVSVVFLCPVSGEQIRSSAQVVQDASEQTKRAVKQSMFRSLRWSMSRMMYNVFGYGVGGVVGQAVTDGAMGSAEARGWQPKEAQVKEATVDAFKSVQNRFAWDASTQRYVAASVFAELQTPFQVLVQSTQLTKEWDRHILARMLAEISAADGEIEESERELFHAFLGGQGPSLDELLAKPPLTGAELQETSANVRELMFSLALAVAISDEQYEKQELAKLGQFAGGLGLTRETVGKLDEMARDYIVDQALEAAYADGVADDAERKKVHAMAARIGVATDRVNRLDARCRKRKGIM